MSCKPKSFRGIGWSSGSMRRHCCRKSVGYSPLRSVKVACTQAKRQPRTSPPHHHIPGGAKFQGQICPITSRIWILYHMTSGIPGLEQMSSVSQSSSKGHVPPRCSCASVGCRNGGAGSMEQGDVVGATGKTLTSWSSLPWYS